MTPRKESKKLYKRKPSSELLIEQKISLDKHFKIAGEFSCGADNPLNNFISSDAFNYEEKKLGNTYVLLSPENMNDIVGFYTLKASGIQIESNGEYISIPVVEIARFAISYDCQRQGFGTYIFHEFILKKIRLVSNLVAVNAIIVFAEEENQQATKFYTSLGFEKAKELVQKEIDDSFNEKCDLYLVSLEEIGQES